MDFGWGPIGSGFNFGQIGEENQGALGFSQYLGNFAQKAPMYDWMKNQYKDVYQRYLGDYTKALSGGQETPTFLSFLQNYDPGQQFQYTAPRERGENPTGYTGRSRTIY